MKATLLLVAGVFLATGLPAQTLTRWTLRVSATGYSVGINPLNPGVVYTQNATRRFLASYDRGRTWQERGIMPSALVREILVHPSDTSIILSAAFDGGLLRSTDDGMTWTVVLADYGIDGESIVCNPAHPDTVFAGKFLNGDVFMSSDRGATWTQTGSLGSNVCAFMARPDSTSILFAGAGQGRIAKSTDRGATWRIVKPSGSVEIPKIVIDPAHPLVAYGAAYAGSDSTTGVWKTTDGGEHWFRTSLRAWSVWSLDIDATNPSVVYAGTFSETVATVFVTTDGGESWSSHSTGLPPAGNSWCLKVHPLDPQAIWHAITGSPAGVYQFLTTHTIIGGTVVEGETGDTVRNGTVTNTRTGESVLLDHSAGTFAFGLFPDDTSASLTMRTTSFPYYVADTAFSFLTDSLIARSVVLHRLPKATIGGVVSDSTALQAVQARVRLTSTSLAGSSMLSDSTDAGGAFAFPDLYISHPPVVRYELLTIDPEVPFAHAADTDLALPPGGLSLTFSLPTADVLVMAGDSVRFGQYYTSALDSSGITWNFQTDTEMGPMHMVQQFRRKTALYYSGNRSTPFSLAEVGSLMAALQGGGNLFLSGQNIAEVNDSTPLLLDVLGVAYAGSPGALIGVAGVPGDLFEGIGFQTLGVGGAGNQTSRDRLTSTRASTVACLSYAVGGTAGVRTVYNGSRILFLGFGFEGITTPAARDTVMRRAIGYLDGSFTLGIGSEPGLPSRYVLMQNYPNPFNPHTTIMFEVPHTSRVELSVYNVLGQRVRMLVDDEVIEGGRYAVQFDGSSLPSGVYLCRMAAGGFSQTMNMLLLR